jgi:acetyltransferase-like isoleucine patch superfamily enzyme
MFGKILWALERDPGGIPSRLAGIFEAWRLSLLSNVELQGKVILLSTPIIDIRKGCRLIIGAGVTLNSRNRGHHVNLFAPVKLFADRPGAVIRIGAETRVNGACLHAYESISIGSRCMIGANCQIFDSSAHDLSFPEVERRIHTQGMPRPIVIEDDVWIGTGSIILPGVTIGRGAVVGAGSVVMRNVPPMSVARGNPAEVVLDYGKLSAFDTF